MSTTSPLASRHTGSLYCGDNLTILREYIPDESVDLIYLDPPFQSGRNYSVVFELKSGRKPTQQMQAFEDTWEWGPESEAAYREITERGGPPAIIMTGLRQFFGESRIMAYLCMMAPRLIELRRVLKPTGSIWLHCDPTASHYLKVLMDAIWGPGCFRNEVIWRYRRWPAKARQLQKMHDVLLYYSRSTTGEHTFHSLYGYESLAESTRRTFGTQKQRADFSSGHRKPGTEHTETPGPPLSDVWEVGVIAAIGRERLGYPTQKPEALLERVILTASNAGDVVLDPFCGSGTAIAVAHKLGRRWIGMDITHLATSLVKHRLHHALGQTRHFDVVGEPETVEDACRLAGSQPYQFGCWILGLLGARSTDKRRGTDSGIDGRLFFRDGVSHTTRAKQVILVVQSAAPSAAHVRDLRSVIEREHAEMGALLTLHPPSETMRAEAAHAGGYTSPQGTYPRIQILAVADILSGKRIHIPSPQSQSATPDPAPAGVLPAEPCTCPGS